MRTSSTHSSIRLPALGAAILTLGMFAASSPATAATSVYQLTKTQTIGGDGGWDYLTYDPSSHHLFISRGTRVMVVDPSNGTVVTEIPNTPGVHGIALASDLGKGFTSNGRENSVTVFDLTTLKETAKIAIEGKNPDAILYDPASKHVFTMNGRSGDATAIDAATNTVVGTIALPGRPEFAASGGDGTIYANIEDKSEIVAIDTKTNAVVHTWPLAPCEGPSGLAIDRENHRLFAACSNKTMAVVDTQSGKVVASVAIGEGVDAAAFDPQTKLAFASNGGDGTLTVIHEDSPTTFSVVQNAATKPYARTMALDTATHNVYLVTAEIHEGPPAAGQTRPTRTIAPGSFAVIVMSKT